MTESRLNTMMAFAARHDYNVTIDDVEEEKPGVLRGLSEYHRRRLRGQFEVQVTRMRLPHLCLH